MIRTDYQEGFTAIELLVALVVGVLFLGSMYQLQVSVLQDSGDAQRRAQASSAAYDILRQYQSNTSIVKKPCVQGTASPTVPSYVTLPGSTASVAITCPFSTASNLSLITVTITYNNAKQTATVSRAIVTRPS